MCADAARPYARAVRSPRGPLAVALLLASGVLPLVAVARGWAWYLDGPLILLLPALGGYAAGRWLARPAALGGGLLVVGAVVLANQRLDAEYHWLDDTVFFLVLVGVPLTVGSVVALRGRQIRALDELRTRLAEQERVEVAAARLEEQSRVHHDLHARLAERIAGIALRAQGAQHTRDSGVLGVLEDESRAVLEQLREGLGSLGRPLPDVGSSPVGTAASAEPDPRDRSPLDVVLALGLGAAMALETLVSSVARGPAAANVLATLLVAAPLVLRRPRPVLAVALTTLAAASSSLWLTPVARTVTGVALVTVVFVTVGAWCRRGSWPLGLAVAVVGTTLVGLASGVSVRAAGAVVVWGLVAASLGRVTAGLHERLRETQEVVTRLEEGRGVALRLARAQEREALAGQLHDTVAHAMTVVCLQAGAARRTGADPAGVLRTVAEAATGSLAELRDGLDALETGERPLEPAQIVALGRSLGVDLDVATPCVEVDDATARLGLRVLREAIVNTARHAPGATATVALRRHDGTLRLEVLDDGGRREPVLRGSGRGLAGLERTIASVGGTLSWGPRPEGGFRVRAEVPEGLGAGSAVRRMGRHRPSIPAVPL